MLTSSGEVHGVLSIIVDLNRLGQSLGVTAVALARHVAAFSTATQKRPDVSRKHDNPPIL